MRCRGFLWLSLSVMIAGCATNATFVPPTTEVRKLAEDNKGIVLLYTSLHDESCTILKALLAKPQPSGRYAETEWINLKFVNDRPKVPTQVILAAGDYGIVAFECRGARNRIYASRKVPFDLSGSYERPIATFNVQAGEVVDIGNLQLPSRLVGPWGWRRPLFNAVVTPIPETWLQNLAASNPNIHSARVTRLMKVPPPDPPPNDPTAAAEAR